MVKGRAGPVYKGSVEVRQKSGSDSVDKHQIEMGKYTIGHQGRKRRVKARASGGTRQLRVLFAALPS